MNASCRSAVQPSNRARTGTGLKDGKCGAAAAGEEAAIIRKPEHKENKNASPCLGGRLSLPFRFPGRGE